MLVEPRRDVQDRVGVGLLLSGEPAASAVKHGTGRTPCALSKEYPVRLEMKFFAQYKIIDVYTIVCDPSILVLSAFRCMMHAIRLLDVDFPVCFQSVKDIRHISVTAVTAECV